jgi:hypothetical protein
MRHIAASPRLLALCAATALLLPGLAQAEPTSPKKAPTSGTSEYRSAISEVDSCNQAQSRIPQDATVTAMRVSTAISGEYGTFTCRVKWSLSPSARPTYRPILFSRSA